ncbi:unnamed protein product, partial [Ascophyllum nodosum]
AAGSAPNRSEWCPQQHTTKILKLAPTALSYYTRYSYAFLSKFAHSGPTKDQQKLIVTRIFPPNPYNMDIQKSPTKTAHGHN